MADIRRERYEKNGTEAIIDTDKIFWLNVKHIEER